MNDSNGIEYHCLAEVPGTEMADQMIHIGQCNICGALVSMDSGHETSAVHTEWHKKQDQNIRHAGMMGIGFGL